MTIGSYDGEEVCELIVLFILNTLKDKFGNKIGLYRDDGLIAFNSESTRLADKTRKELTKIFSGFGLEITAQINSKSVNFLDINFNQANEKFQPYRKPNDELIYVNSRSNHLPSIVKQLLASINRRSSKLSCD